MNGSKKSVLFLFVNILFAVSVKCDCNLNQELISEIRSYASVVEQIINATTNGNFKGGTYKELALLVDTFGARVSGTDNLENSIDYMLNLMESYGIENVHGENVTVPHWVRGEEHAELVEPRQTNIPVLSLGNSVATPTDGIEAEVLVVKSFEELAETNNSAAAVGKIVVFNPEWVSYGLTVPFRSRGANEAARHGAVAVLIRSVTPFSMSTLHTGNQNYDDDVDKIPTACITVEDANMLQRIQDRGEKIVIKLTTQPETLPDVTSRNAIGDIVGESLPEKIVLVSGHIDSWDVGVGALDDGGGAFISWYALAVIKALGLRPRRTLRAVLWTAEEQGLIGAYAYNVSHYEELLENYTFVMESDEGTFTPLGLEYATGEQGGCILQEILNLLSSINTTQAVYSGGSSVASDIGMWTGRNGIIPGASLLNDNDRYFWYHHTTADTMDVLDPDDLDKATALWASVAYIIADLSVEFPRETYYNVSDSDNSETDDNSGSLVFVNYSVLFVCVLYVFHTM